MNFDLEVYGAKMTIKEIASVHSISGGVEVTPYDKNLIKSIEKRLNDSDLGLVTKKENSVLLKFPL